MNATHRCVEIHFDCLPLRSVGRLDIPLDASPKFRQRCERVKAAIDEHGSHNSYYLHNARCVFRLLNDPDLGKLEFAFEGVLLTNASDSKADRCHLQVTLASETCDWLTQPIVRWFEETVHRAVLVEFDHYIAAGDLEQTRKRLETIEEASDDAGGYLGMYL